MEFPCLAVAAYLENMKTFEIYAELTMGGAFVRAVTVIITCDSPLGSRQAQAVLQVLYPTSRVEAVEIKTLN